MVVPAQKTKTNHLWLFSINKRAKTILCFSQNLFDFIFALHLS